MTDEITFLDLMALSKIGPDTVVEKFGSVINSSFFDASNFLGGLKIKGLVDFTTSFPGQSTIVVTDAGKHLLQDVEEKSKIAADPLDIEILGQLSRGKRSLTDLSGAINVAQLDLATHLYRLVKQDYAMATFRNATLDMVLTEKGFMTTKTAQPHAAGPQEQMATARQGIPEAIPVIGSTLPGAAAKPAVATSTTTGTPSKNNLLEEVDRIRKTRAKNQIIRIAVVAIVLIIIVVLFELYMLHRL
jgi:hypothetical protein